jgi:3-oxoacyl-[acyl-carrier protein] reductase
VETWGGIDILINNAAILMLPGALGPMATCPLDVWEETMRVNLNGPFYVTRAALPIMAQQRWGRILTAGSYAGLGPMGGSAYTTAKSALFGFSRAIASDYGPYGITSNVYNPEARTPMSDQTPDQWAKAHKRYLERGYRTEAEVRYIDGIGGPDGISPWVTYLCTDEADYINGRVFAVESRRIAMIALPDEERFLFRDAAQQGPWSLEELCKLAPLVFPVSNAWPRREGEALARWEKA